MIQQTDIIAFKMLVSDCAETRQMRRNTKYPDGTILQFHCQHTAALSVIYVSIQE